MTELENIEYKQSLPLDVVRRAGKKKKEENQWKKKEENQWKKKTSARRAELWVRVKRIKIVE